MLVRNKPNRDINLYYFVFVTVQSLAPLCLTLCDSTDCACQASLSCLISRSLLRLMSVETAMSFSHLILCHPLLLMPSIFPRIGVFSKESALSISWPKYWSFSFSISPSNDFPMTIQYSGLISFRIDWFNRLAVQGTLKSILFYNFFFFFNIAGVSFLFLLMGVFSQK